MGKEGKYDLKLAETPMMSDSDSEAEEETLEEEIMALGDTGSGPAVWNIEVSDELNAHYDVTKLIVALPFYIQ